MKRIFPLVIACLAVVASAMAQDKAKPIRVPFPVRVAFQLTVGERPAYSNSTSTADTVTVADRGLSISVQPELATTGLRNPLSFQVVVKNTSRQQLTISNPDGLGDTLKLVVSNQKTLSQWTIATSPTRTQQGTITLQPGNSITRYVTAQAPAIANPLPIPFPRPVPRPGVPQPNDQRRPIFAPPISPNLPCGEGPCLARLFFDFTGAGNTVAVKLAAPAVGFTVSSAIPPIVQPPIIPRPPVVVGPPTKEQAITIAKNAAEQALSTHYRPVPPFKPANTGTWIKDPIKTATVANENGNWRVSWTAFPKSGFSYNVAVLVTPSRQTSVVEVFAGYSPKR